VRDSGRSERRRIWFRPVQVAKETRQGADHGAGEALVHLLDSTGKAEVEGLLARGESRREYVYAVRRVRELTGLRLIDARRLVDSLRR